MFEVRAGDEGDFFGQPTFLTVSGQLEVGVLRTGVHQRVYLWAHIPGREFEHCTTRQ